MPELTAVVVNYNSGEYLVRCVASLMGQKGFAGIRVVVVDSASTEPQGVALSAVRHLGAEVVELPENGGYAHACNRGQAIAGSGRYLLFSNADVEFVESDCLRRCADALDRDPRAAIAAPRSYLDRDLEFCCPEFTPLTRRGLLGELTGRRWSRWARIRQRGLERARVLHWQRQTVAALPGLSGAVLLCRPTAIREVGGFDPGYPLYYEDSDLFRRLRTARRRLLSVPAARVVHFAHRSSAKDWAQAMRKAAQGRERYLRRHLGRPWVALDRQVLDRSGLGPGPEPIAIDLGELGAAPQCDAGPGSARGCVWEIAFEPRFAVAAGCLRPGGPWRMSSRCWESLGPQDHFLRVLDSGSLRELRRWRFRRRAVASADAGRERVGGHQVG